MQAKRSRKTSLQAYKATGIVTLKRTKPKPHTIKQRKTSTKSNNIYGYILSLQKRAFKEGIETCVIEAIKQDFKLTENSVNLENLNRRYQICPFPSLELCYSVHMRISNNVNVILV